MVMTTKEEREEQEEISRIVNHIRWNMALPRESHILQVYVVEWHMPQEYLELFSNQLDAQFLIDG